VVRVVRLDVDRIRLQRGVAAGVHHLEHVQSGGDPVAGPHPDAAGKELDRIRRAFGVDDHRPSAVDLEVVRGGLDAGELLLFVPGVGICRQRERERGLLRVGRRLRDQEVFVTVDGDLIRGARGQREGRQRGAGG
jgi:hypothetical protein